MIIGIDTSNYTTSLCVIDKGQIIDEKRKMIDVKPGAKGIRQSDAFYQHMHVLHSWLQPVLKTYRNQVVGVGVSSQPRPIDGSYMPCFKSGLILSQVVADALDVPLMRVSHQEGHLEAAAATSDLAEERFVFMHLSGGTTEMHEVTLTNQRPHMQLIAETADISIGQLVDRIGVYAGLLFPCGAEMDKRAIVSDAPSKSTMPSFNMAKAFNLSGYENHYKKKIDQNPTRTSEVFYDLFCGVSGILKAMILSAVKDTGLSHVLLAGGVASSQTLRTLLLTDPDLQSINLVFSHPYYASDNAYGVALIAERLFSDSFCLGG